jgi:hypothetical protein
MQDVDSRMVVGSSVVGGHEVHHLALRRSAVDWKIWIEKSNRLVPRKYVIASNWISNATRVRKLFMSLSKIHR